MKGPAIVTNTSNGTIIGDFYGVRLFSGGSVQNDGYITSVLTAGVFFKTGGTLNNTGTIKNYGPAVRSDAAATITNSGLMTVTSGGGAAVRFNGGTITNMMSGKILANGEGVNTNVGSSPATTIINAGTIGSVGTAFPHNGVYMGGTGTDSVTNQSTGRIYGTTGGLHMARGGTVLNQGTLRAMGASTYGTGLYIGGVSSVTNASGATITGPVAGVQMTLASHSSLVNYGVIRGTGTSGQGRSEEHTS